jgi:hypothetical protein
MEPSVVATFWLLRDIRYLLDLYESVGGRNVCIKVSAVIMCLRPNI